jgi:uncharacterized protein (TIGR00725 family)
MTRPFIVGVMGGGVADDQQQSDAYALGKHIARQGWVLLNGGRDAGVMAASAKGAREEGGLTIGILPDSTAKHAAKHIQIPIVTGMGNARNCINILSSDVVVACPGGMGTLSEIALAAKCQKPIILLKNKMAKSLASFLPAGRLFYADSPLEVIDHIRAYISNLE